MAEFSWAKSMDNTSLKSYIRRHRAEIAAAEYRVRWLQGLLEDEEHEADLRGINV